MSRSFDGYDAAALWQFEWAAYRLAGLLDVIDTMFYMSLSGLVLSLASIMTP